MDDVTVLESVTPVNGASALIRLKSSLSSRPGPTEQTHRTHTHCSKDTVLATQPLSAIFLSLELKDNLSAMLDFFFLVFSWDAICLSKDLSTLGSGELPSSGREEASGSNCLNKKHCCP